MPEQVAIGTPVSVEFYKGESRIGKAAHLGTIMEVLNDQAGRLAAIIVRDALDRDQIRRFNKDRDLKFVVLTEDSYYRLVALAKQAAEAHEALEPHTPPF
jgi:hypothetical protein